MKQPTNSADFSTISPSARSLLLLKGNTDIPFAREAAAVIGQPEEENQRQQPLFWGRVFHFEQRYWSITQLLEDTSIRNILELSSGYSFRGLDLAQQPGYYYIDTDLPNVVATKQRIIPLLHATLHPASHFELTTLNVLDTAQLNTITGAFPEGPIAIVNEGLLMYLNTNEKKQLGKSIHAILKRRGGYWITGDIYVPRGIMASEMKMDEQTKAFAEQHHIRENMFSSFDSAADFFKEMGFEVDQVAAFDPSRLTSLARLRQSIPQEQLTSMKDETRIRETWRLKAI